MQERVVTMEDPLQSLAQPVKQLARDCPIRTFQARYCRQAARICEDPRTHVSSIPPKRICLLCTLPCSDIVRLHTCQIGGWVPLWAPLDIPGQVALSPDAELLATACEDGCRDGKISGFKKSGFWFFGVPVIKIMVHWGLTRGP